MRENEKFGSAVRIYLIVYFVKPPPVADLGEISDINGVRRSRVNPIYPGIHAVFQSSIFKWMSTRRTSSMTRTTI